jgi:AP2 domain/HNH endonuclease
MMQIPLTQGKYALVDLADFDELSKSKWHFNAQGYAARNVVKSDGKRAPVTMHRMILDAQKGIHVDHINGNRLDNRRVNLRLCTSGENLMNTNGQTRRVYSKFKGVTWDKNRKKWIAQIQAYGEHKMLGRFGSEEQAAAAYDNAAKNMHGAFARINQL